MYMEVKLLSYTQYDERTRTDARVRPQISKRCTVGDSSTVHEGTETRQTSRTQGLRSVQHPGGHLYRTSTELDYKVRRGQVSLHWM